jgi:Raf kinase inhibitor-like YbhB/YbcL family protein
MPKILKYLLPAVVLFISCQNKNNEKTVPETKNQSESVMEMKITSSAFEEGGMIPSKYSCDSENVSPPLSWSDAPTGIKTFAVICDDPDAPGGTWVHWVIYNIPAGASGLPEAVPVKKEMDNGAVQGLNDFRKTGYGGPCPPSGTHRYYFKIYALDAKLNPAGDVTKDILLDAMKEHILAQGELTGKYSRK